MNKENNNNLSVNSKREFYQRLSEDFHKNKTEEKTDSTGSKKAELHRQMTNVSRSLNIQDKLGTSSNNQIQIGTEQIKKIFSFKEELGEDGSKMIIDIANKGIGPAQIKEPDNLHTIAQMIYAKTNPSIEPVTIKRKTKPLGFLPIGGTETVKTIYNNDYQTYPTTNEDPITYERISFPQRILNKLLGHR